MLLVTFIRHGESEDNSKDIWAGWKDSPLSRLGRRQAQAVADYFKDTHFDHIYASDLHRARETGEAIHSRLADPKPPFTITPLVREQHFGVAEGQRWVMHIEEGQSREGLYAQNIYPVLLGRQARFENGESLDDLAVRAQQALIECILPHLSKCGDIQSKESHIHIAIASHGLAISELIAALIRWDPEADKSKNYKGLLNTAWARVEVRIRDGHSGPVDPSNVPPLGIKVTHFNQTKHLEALTDEDIKDEDEVNEARAFFGGASPDPAVSATNARVDVAGQQPHLQSFNHHTSGANLA